MGATRALVTDGTDVPINGFKLRIRVRHPTKLDHLSSSTHSIILGERRREVSFLAIVRAGYKYGDGVGTINHDGEATAGSPRASTMEARLARKVLVASLHGSKKKMGMN
ncbi:hypothetical protein CC1G_14851 [Coprinopsis cinerea okayama7|uniref:Uncharacterized protein n=1 Tax=Coprinopsis cinerea (strain Okayama-7 / 130 / ATCC MYA-4618 / FGSC 9003) TaxID=240176 RepID=D6RNR2_COPC7|nr:hypothetical protein CC1G_14851 [Coprinopsis cinerea okayama7\|eukprot:XP_002910874.1 hypothetical protein CC1G_14851 [Coprinopsis cinerea okayama7\